MMNDPVDNTPKHADSHINASQGWVDSLKEALQKELSSDGCLWEEAVKTISARMESLEQIGTTEGGPKSMFVQSIAAFIVRFADKDKDDKIDTSKLDEKFFNTIVLYKYHLWNVAAELVVFVLNESFEMSVAPDEFMKTKYNQCATDLLNDYNRDQQVIHRRWCKDITDVAVSSLVRNPPTIMFVKRLPVAGFASYCGDYIFLLESLITESAIREKMGHDVTTDVNDVRNTLKHELVHVLLRRSITGMSSRFGCFSPDRFEGDEKLETDRGYIWKREVLQHDVYDPLGLTPLSKVLLR